MRSKKLNTPLYCKYTVNLSEAGFAELSAELEERLTGYQIKDLIFHSGWETEDGFIPLAASQNNDAGLEWQKVKGRIVFTDSEVKSMTRCIIVPYDRSSLKPGDTVIIPPNVKHWHGAKKDSWFSHIAIEVPGENGKCNQA